MPRRALAVAALALAATAPAVAAAQTTLAVDLALNSAFVWRGVTSTNRVVIDPSLLLTVPVKGASLTFGGWANAEPGHYDGEHDIGVLGGSRGPLVTTSQLWVEGARELRSAKVTLGATRYLYPHVGTLSETYATNEVYGIASLAAPLSPTVSLYYDVQKVHGAYMELGLAQDVALPRLPALSFGAAVGYSAGQGVNDLASETAYFSHNGVTHVDLSVKTSYTLGSIAVNPTAHVVAGRDAWTRVTAPDESHRVKAWFGASLSWAGPLARRHAAPTPAAAPVSEEAPPASGTEAGRTDGKGAR